MLLNCKMYFAIFFFIIKKSRIVCVVQILFVILQRFCMVRTLHLWQKHVWSVDEC